MTPLAVSQRIALATAVLDAAALARARGVTLPQDLLLDIDRVQAMAKAWDESRVARWPAGDPRGGQFAPKDGVGGNTQTPTSQLIFERAANPNYRHSFGAGESGGLMRRHLSEAGFSEGAIDKASQLLNAYGYGEPSQSRAVGEILQSIRDQDEVGKALIEAISLETAVSDALVESLPAREADARKRAAESFDSDIRWGLDIQHRGAYYEKHERQAYIDDVAGNAEDFLMIYRRGDPVKAITSWSRNVEGAVMRRGEAGIGWDHRMSLRDIRSKGYRVLGGLVSLMGAPGEAEVTLIRWPIPDRVEAKRYNPDQPRVPAGDPDGGQWTSGGAGGGAEARQPLPPAKPARPTQVVYREPAKGDTRWAMDALGVDESELRQMFELDGYVARLEVYTGDQLYSSPRKHKPAFIVRAEWYDTRGKLVGKAERLIMDEGEHQICYNEEMKFEPEFQDHDLGHQLYERQIAVLAKDTEVDAIRMFADISIGRYAWAKKGFQYYRPEEVASHNAKFRQWLTRQGIELPDVPTFTTPQDFANFRVPGVKISHRDIRNDDVRSGDYEVGKAFMLDGIGHGDWSGVLWLKK